MYEKRVALDHLRAFETVRFKTDGLVRWFSANVAQLVVLLICNQVVGSSNLSVGSKINDFGRNHAALVGILTNLVVEHIVVVGPVAKLPIVAIVHTAQQSSAAVVGPRYIAAIAHIAP